MKTGKKKGLLLALDFILLLLLLAADQASKAAAVLYLKGQSAIVVLSGVLQLQYLENHGVSFGMLTGKTWLIIVLCLVFMACVCAFLWRIPAQKKYLLLHILLSFVMAGGLGNLIDRIRLGYVVDFLYFVRLEWYPIFNVADCFIVGAVIGLFILFLFVYKEEDLTFLETKKSKKQVSAGQVEAEKEDTLKEA